MLRLLARARMEPTAFPWPSLPLPSSCLICNCRCQRVAPHGQHRPDARRQVHLPARRRLQPSQSARDRLGVVQLQKLCVRTHTHSLSILSSLSCFHLSRSSLSLSLSHFLFLTFSLSFALSFLSFSLSLSLFSNFLSSLSLSLFLSRRNLTLLPRISLLPQQDLGQFDVVLLANLICRLPEPMGRLIHATYRAQGKEARTATADVIKFYSLFKFSYI